MNSTQLLEAVKEFNQIGHRHKVERLYERFHSRKRRERSFINHFLARCKQIVFSR